jgi:hypothetical protein
LNWDYWKGLTVEYWYHLVFLVMVLIVVAVSLYYVRNQLNDRIDRLRTLNLYEMEKTTEGTPEVAPVDPVVNGMLFPRPKVYLPLQDRFEPRENWGDPVRSWTVRGEEPPVRSAPKLRGP